MKMRTTSLVFLFSFCGWDRNKEQNQISKERKGKDFTKPRPQIR